MERPVTTDFFSLPQPGEKPGCRNCKWAFMRPYHWEAKIALCNGPQLDMSREELFYHREQAGRSFDHWCRRWSYDPHLVTSTPKQVGEV